MALLKISEPGEKPAIPVHRFAVGIDLGTTNSLVSASCGQSIEVLPDNDGECLLPSVVQYSAEVDPVVGKIAIAAAINDPKNTISSAKRLLGRSIEEVLTVPQFKHYDFDSQRTDSIPAIITAAGIKDSVQVSADILRTLVNRAEKCLGGKLEGAVITVPAYFNDAQRQQTKDAATQIKHNYIAFIATIQAISYGRRSRLIKQTQHV